MRDAPRLQASHIPGVSDTQLFASAAAVLKRAVSSLAMYRHPGLEQILADIRALLPTLQARAARETKEKVTIHTRAGRGQEVEGDE